MSTDDYVPVCDRSDLEAEGRTVVQQDGRAIALFYHEEEVHAVDDRCPHMVQNASAAVRRADALDREAERRPALVAGARYLAAHTPTRREQSRPSPSQPGSTAASGSTKPGAVPAGRYSSSSTVPAT